mgnify:CR=1 FL=1
MAHRIQTRLYAWLGAALLIAGAIGLLHCSPGPAAPNIILVTLDTTRADRLGCYGYPLASTPHLDRFAEEAVRFHHAITTVPLTLPAHASILTGQNPPAHGVRNNGAFVLQPGVQTLTEDLAAHGYTTAAFVSCFVLHRQFGIAQGFQVYDDDLVAEERSAHETTLRAIEWLESAPETPFFLWVHYFDPHSPYEPIEPFASQTRGSPYDAEISAMDAGIGDLMSSLQRLGHYDDAHILMLADHGEGLGDHREYEHGIFLYDECLRIPFLWKLPGSAEGSTVQPLVGTVDIVPTLLDFVGLAPPAQTDGASLRDLLTGGAAPARAGLYAETLYPYYSYDWSPLYAWCTDRWKFIEAPEPELYDLVADPKELTNLAVTHEDQREQLAKYLRTTKLRSSGPESAPAEESIDPAVAEKLASLGYVWTGSKKTTTPPDSLPDPKAMIRYHEHFEKGKLAVAGGRPGEAIDEFEALLAVYPDNHTATYLMGLALLKEDRPAEALHWLERHMELGENPVATLAMGQALLALGRPREALTWFGKHLEAGSQKAAAHEFSGDALIDLGRTDEALEAYRQASRLVPSPRRLWKEAMALLRLGQLAQAQGRLSEGAALAEPEDRRAWDAWVAAAHRLPPRPLDQPAASPEAFTQQIRSLAQLALYDEARELIEQAQGGFAPALLMMLRGDVAGADKEWVEAREAYEHADRLGAEWPPENALRWAMALVHLEAFGDASQVLESSIRKYDDPAGWLHYNLACTLARAGRPEEALQALAGARERGYANLAAARQDPDLAVLRSHPDFERLTTPQRP